MNFGAEESIQVSEAHSVREANKVSEVTLNIIKNCDDGSCCSQQGIATEVS